MSFWMVLLERSAGGFRLAMLALGPIAAIVFYGYVMSRYRNADKSYQFEDTTRIEVDNPQGADNYHGSISRTTESHVPGYEYSREPRNRLARGSY
jgi:hypothetical protein